MTGTKPYYFVCVFITSSTLLPTYSAVANPHSLDAGWRIRYSDLEDGNNQGKASSILLHSTIKSRWHDNVRTLIEATHVETGHDDEHSDGVRFNGKPVIPDPQGSDLNQAWFQWNINDNALRIGRQTIEHDDQRFIGSVSFWQNAQSFDAVHFSIPLLEQSKFSFEHINKALRIFGRDADEALSPDDLNYESANGQRPTGRLGEHDHDTQLVRLELNEWDYSKLVFFTYLIENETAPSTSNDTVGLRHQWKYKPSKLQYRVLTEIATQKRTGLADSPRVSYAHIDAGLGLQSFELSLRHEQLGNDGNVSFITPLASLHEYHGWADKFSAVPAEGLVDQSLKLKWRKAPWKVDIRFHHFTNEEHKDYLGSELDFDIIYRINKQHKILLRYADYKAPSNNSTLEDTKRVFLNYSFDFDTKF